MSIIPENPEELTLIRWSDAEAIELPGNVHYLLADSDDTHGVISSHRVQLTRDRNGAVPHHHTHSAEFFYILEGSAQLLAGQQVLTATDGDLAVVPVGMHHAFAASPGKTCDLLILITPGVQRFDYPRLLRAIARGERPRESLLDVQDRFDAHFDDSPEWNKARSVVGNAGLPSS